MVTWWFRADDSSEWFADGVSLGESANWREMSTTHFLSNTTVLAVHAQNYQGGCWVVGHASTRFSTDLTWTCTTSDPGSNEWKTDSDFDDSTWTVSDRSNAVASGIWASPDCTAQAFCRKTFANMEIFGAYF